ncbi:N-acetyl-gamma-glutamyl-phosphate reductase [Algicola sagamiensis]|uniref:N-acetyl-gamma-glutamyl-phosphate reductase n=1 Tax=Algicola sagamiensis TaxID=163869 RepID=UPI000370806D|nr:N-acetyl-gamma-glutamyl-phosphate reductase [Algicola sagamiensis]
MQKVIIIGASGYTGATLTGLVFQHPNLEIAGLYVSEHSQDKGKSFSALHSKWQSLIDLPLQPLALSDIKTVANHADIVCLATSHEVSHALAPRFLREGVRVLDLSGAFRLQDSTLYSQYYGFSHQESEYLQQAVYGLAEWYPDAIATASLIAVPGCYPTASLLGLKPLQEAGLIAKNSPPIIHAISGVSGAGRKASIKNHLCELSVQPYGVFEHRHQPEISQLLQQEVIFTPHLGAFPRGILATITLELLEGTSDTLIQDAFESAYHATPLVRILKGQTPSIHGVSSTPFCDIAWKRHNNHLIVMSAIDNLLKGAASQAIQCINIQNSFSSDLGLNRGIING